MIYSSLPPYPILNFTASFNVDTANPFVHAVMRLSEDAFNVRVQRQDHVEARHHRSALQCLKEMFVDVIASEHFPATIPDSHDRTREGLLHLSQSEIHRGWVVHMPLPRPNGAPSIPWPPAHSLNFNLNHQLSSSHLTIMATRLPENLTEMPDIPKDFGDDGVHFYRYYDELAEESDEDLVKNLKAQLDGILIFAGLFAGVNSAFLALTLPQMSANPADDTNALLLQIALAGNGSITSAADLPSASFTPPPRIFLVNVLFSVSLTLALFSSLLAVLGQQWIVYYRKRCGGGPEYQRWEQLRRYLGAKRWRLELVLDDLGPSMLQLGLVIFCIAFALYLGTLSWSLNHIIVWPLYTILVMSTGCVFDPWCPFKQPLSRIVRPVGSAILAVVPWLGYCLLGVVGITGGHIINAIGRAKFFCRSPNVAEPLPPPRFHIFPLLKCVKVGIAEFADFYRWIMLAGIRSAEDPAHLKIEALRRVICTSENRNALIYAAINLQVIRDERALSSLGKDVEFCSRVSSLQQTALHEARHGRTGNHYSYIESRLFSASFFHILFSTYSAPDFTYELDELRVSESLSIPLDQIGHLHQGSVIALEKSCDQCSHCASLLFSISVVYSIAEYARNRRSPLNLDTAFRLVAEVSAGTHDLRLGFMTASVMLISKQLDDERLAGPVWRFEARFLETLFASYRETSEREMFQMICRAVINVNAQWRRKPDHDIYVWLFELCLLHGRKEISAGCHDVLDHVDDHLLPIERQIRSWRVSETDRQRGRDQRNRCVQAVANFFVAREDSPQDAWSLIGHSLMRYLESVAKLMEANPRHPENPRTMMVLRRIEASLAAPSPLMLGEYEPYSRFRRLLGRVDPSRAREVYQDLGLPCQRLCCIRQRGETWHNKQGTALHMLAL
ncbi:hypothetical protein M407DRAFT_31918 [Tulasnella calospora MUT 4182]|uniref:DUF6535 domain-containing protein n=1 Tax=Tulasnella calospora MUT 4182 TaxID=1051891 RepID=A0A0C3Q5N3_9AGAM|nr:hypothetical protein M407DRAFT_31918 [Tulasnella calospora MUT 4182]